MLPLSFILIFHFSFYSQNNYLYLHSLPGLRGERITVIYIQPGFFTPLFFFKRKKIRRAIILNPRTLSLFFIQSHSLTVGLPSLRTWIFQAANPSFPSAPSRLYLSTSQTFNLSSPGPTSGDLSAREPEAGLQKSQTPPFPSSNLSGENSSPPTLRPSRYKYVRFTRTNKSLLQETEAPLHLYLQFFPHLFSRHYFRASR